MTSVSDGDYTFVTHNDRYEIAQKTYLEARANGNKRLMNSAYLEMYTVLTEIERHYISNYCKRHGFKLDDFSFEEKVDDAVFYILEQYITKPNWKIDRVSAYAHFGMQKALFESNNDYSYEGLIEANDENDFASDNDRIIRIK